MYIAVDIGTIFFACFSPTRICTRTPVSFCRMDLCLILFSRFTSEPITSVQYPIYLFVVLGRLADLQGHSSGTSFSSGTSSLCWAPCSRSFGSMKFHEGWIAIISSHPPHHLISISSSHQVSNLLRPFILLVSIEEWNGFLKI